MSEEEKIEVVTKTNAPAEADVMASTVHSATDPVVSPKTLLEAGCHFGHRVSHWNPKMRPFIYGKRNNLHIIDLNKSAAQMQKAYQALKKIVEGSNGTKGKVLFVGTKAYAQKAIREEAIRSGSFYVTHRWLGGTLTNFRTIRKRVDLLNELEARIASDEFSTLPKKTQAEKLKLRDKLNMNLEGLKAIRQLPNAIVVVDPKAEHNAIAEARILHIPVFALGDTNTDPDEIDYLIPANDDSESSIRIVVGLLADAVVEGKNGEPLYAYKDAAAVSGTMAEMLKSVDPNEQIKSIRTKLRDDSIAMRKSGKGSGRTVRRKAVRKFTRKPAATEENKEATTETTAAEATSTEENK